MIYLLLYFLMSDEQYKATVEHKSVLTLCTEYQNKQIDLNAKYQRDVVWKDEQKSAFINSVYKNIVPNNIILNLNHETGKFICVDGKQRVTSLYEFRKNKIPLEWENETLYYDKVPEDYKKNKNFRILTNQEKAKFDNRSIPIVKYEDLSYEDQVDIFNRIQKGAKLTSGEIIMSVFTTDRGCDKFKDFCENHKKLISKYVVSNRDRKGHVILLADLIYILQTNNNNLPSKKQRDDFLRENGTAKKLKEVLEPFEEKLKILFSKELFNAPEFTKSIINKMNQGVFLSLFVCIKEKYEDLTKMKNNELISLKENILETINETIKLGIKGSRNADTVDKVQKLFDKKTVVEDSDSDEIIADSDESESEEEVVVKSKIKNKTKSKN